MLKYQANNIILIKNILRWSGNKYFKKLYPQMRFSVVIFAFETGSCQTSTKLKILLPLPVCGDYRNVPPCLASCKFAESVKFCFTFQTNTVAMCQLSKYQCQSSNVAVPGGTVHHHSTWETKTGLQIQGQSDILATFLMLPFRMLRSKTSSATFVYKGEFISAYFEEIQKFIKFSKA